MSKNNITTPKGQNSSIMEDIIKKGGQTPETESNEVNPNKQFFDQELIARIPKGKLDEKLGGLKPNWRKDEDKTVLTEEDQKILNDYKRLEVKDLPEDWKKQLIRKDYLELNWKDHDKIVSELKNWTEVFNKEGENTPQLVLSLLNKLRQDHEGANGELNAWKEIFKDKTVSEAKEEKESLTKKVDLLEKELKGWRDTFPKQDSQEVKQKIDDLEKEFGDWKKLVGDRTFPEFKEEWENLRKRPDIPFTEQVFWDDFARRMTLEEGRLLQDEFVKEKKKAGESKEENDRLWIKIEKFLEMGRTRRYVLAKPVRNVKEAHEAIAELLEKTERDWTFYLENEGKNDAHAIVTRNNDLSFYFQDKENKNKAYQILAWISEARKTFDYQTLFERWCGGKKYDKKYDFDGGLYLLEQYLEVKDVEDPQTGSHSHLT